MTQLEIWPQRPMYFAAAIATHHSKGGGMSVVGGGGIFLEGGLTLVFPWLMVSRGEGLALGEGEPKVPSSLKPLALQYYFAPIATKSLQIWP